MKSKVEIDNQEIALVRGIMRIVHEFKSNRFYLLVTC